MQGNKGGVTTKPASVGTYSTPTRREPSVVEISARIEGAVQVSEPLIRESSAEGAPGVSKAGRGASWSTNPKHLAARVRDARGHARAGVRPARDSSSLR